MSADERVDVLVIGGGIHGAGVAQAAAAGGYNVMLVEQHGIASGTSSRSSKLIHGGLRYLEQGELRLVRECLAERELLLRIAPTLVHRVPFLIPVYRFSRRRPALIRAGLTVYSLLAGGRRHTRFRAVPKSEWDRLDGLSVDGLQRVFEYPDAQTDDRRLTEAVVDSAAELGARIHCPATFVAGRLEDDECVATIALAGTGERTIEVRCRAIVNSAGPWANAVLSRFQPALPSIPFDCIQGAHLELPGAIHQGCYYLEVPSDKRAVFVMPWHDRTLLGTTEHEYRGDPGAVQPLAVEVDYLLETYRRYFPGRSLEVLDKWAGLRVLPGEGRAFGRSRETLLVCGPGRPPRVVSIIGGKLTAYRITAQRTLARLRRTLPRRAPRADTRTLPLKARA